MWYGIEKVRRWLFGTDPLARLELALANLNDLTDELDNVRKDAANRIAEANTEISQLQKKVDQLTDAYAKVAKVRNNIINIIGE